MSHEAQNFLGRCTRDLARQFRDQVPRQTGAELADQAPAEVGVIHVYDLANTGSLFAIQTADLGRALPDGFEVLGREPGAEARGCSIAIDELLGTQR